jgi:prepilin-type N-terminal cleavage/methylation domain-containing protein
VSARRAQAGFSLTELLFATLLFSVIAAGLAGITSLAFRGRSRLVTRASAHDSAVLIRHAVSAALDTATYVELPSAGALSGALTAWDNVDADGSSAIIAARPRRFSHLCADAGQERFYLYRGDHPKPAFSCGDSPEGVERMLVAGGAGMWIIPRFYRPAGEANLVQFDAGVRADGTASEADRSASIQMEMGISHAKD